MSERQQRITELCHLLLRGAERQEIDDHTQAWALEKKVLDGYLAQARRQLKRYSKADRAAQVEAARQRLGLLFDTAFERMELPTALAAQREINRLEALYAAPAARTLRLLGMDDLELAELAELLRESGVDAKDVFASMKGRLMQGKQAKAKRAEQDQAAALAAKRTGKGDHDDV